MLAVMKGGRPTRERYPAINPNIWSMLEQCWHIDPAQRPSMETLSIFFDPCRPKPLFILDPANAEPRVANKQYRPVLEPRDVSGSYAASRRKLKLFAKSCHIYCCGVPGE
jgi:hypothetical protein